MTRLTHSPHDWHFTNSLGNLKTHPTNSPLHYDTTVLLGSKTLQSLPPNTWALANSWHSCRMSLLFCPPFVDTWQICRLGNLRTFHQKKIMSTSLKLTVLTLGSKGSISDGMISCIPWSIIVQRVLESVCQMRTRLLKNNEIRDFHGERTINHACLPCLVIRIWIWTPVHQA